MYQTDVDPTWSWSLESSAKEMVALSVQIQLHTVVFSCYTRRVSLKTNRVDHTHRTLYSVALVCEKSKGSTVEVRNRGQFINTSQT